MKLVNLTTVILWNSLLCFLNANNVDNTDSLNDNKDKPIELRPRVITKETFDEVIQEPSIGTFVMYQAPWCGHCKRMLTTWTELAQRHNHQKKFLIAKIDCTVDTDFCSENDILGYPTFIFYQRSNSVGLRYDGARDMETMELFMFNQITSETLVDDVSNIDAVFSLTEADFEKFISQGNHFIKFFAPWCGHCQRMAQTWKNIALKYSKLGVKVSEVDCTKQTSICQSYDVKGYPTLILFKDGKKVENYNGQRSLEGFSKFLDEMTAQNIEQPPGQLIELNTNNYANILSQPGFTFVKYFAPWCGHCKNMAPTWLELAQKLGSKVRIAELDCTMSDEICMNNNINGYPTLILYRNGQKIEEYPGARDLESLVSFVNKHLLHEEL